MNAIESVSHPGYYAIPGYSSYLISRTGDVINIGRDSRLSGSANPAGYHNFRLVGDDGETLTWGRHRLLGHVFKSPEESISGLVINHENGIKGDDRLDNLEWKTQQGNVEHAGQHGLTEKCIPISVRNADTGHVSRFPSCIAAAEVLGLTKDAILYRVKEGESRVFPERRQYRKGWNDHPWAVVDDVDRALLANSTSKAVLVRNVSTGNVATFRQLSEMASAYGVALPTASMWLDRSGQPVLPGGIQVKWTTDTTPWRVVDDPEGELAGIGGRRRVVATEASTGKETVYSTAKDCAGAFGLKVTTLSERLKSNGAKVYKEGFTFKYF